MAWRKTPVRGKPCEELAAAMRANPLLLELWRVKDQLAAEAGYDMTRFCKQLDEWVRAHGDMVAAVGRGRATASPRPAAVNASATRRWGFAHAGRVGCARPHPKARP